MPRCQESNRNSRDQTYVRHRSPEVKRRPRRALSRSRSPASRTSSRQDERRRVDKANEFRKANPTGKVAKRKIWKKIRLQIKQRKALKRQIGTSEHQRLCRVTEDHLKSILESNEFLGDIPFNYTPQELKGEIALTKDQATTIYVERDGLSTLTIVLPQAKPTIANLKRAIEATARTQLQREQRQRYEDRLRRRGEQTASNNSANDSSSSSGDREDDIAGEASRSEQHEGDRQQVCKPTRKSLRSVKTEPPLTLTMRNPGELVNSEAFSGQHHRANVSWRFLWRAYALFNVDSNQPLDDENGRKLLTECGIENAATLKFTSRPKYFGRKRQP